MFKLSKGTIQKIVVSGERPSQPIMQVTQIKTIQNQSVDAQTRYKVSLYDGETHHSFGILATQRNYLIEQEDLKVGSVIQLTDYQPNVLSQEPKKVVIILVEVDVLGEMEVGTSPDKKENKEPQAVLSKPSIVKHTIESPAKPTAQEQHASNQKPPTKSFYGDKQRNEPQKKPIQPTSTLTSSGGGASNGMFNGFKVFDIASLNPYQNKWSIKARCINKSAIRTWSNARGEGKLFSVDLVDASGEIRASGFNDQCEKYYDYFQIDKVFYISRAQLKTANKQYNTLNNDYEMTLTNESAVEECQDDGECGTIPRLSLNLIPISDISNKQANDIIDMIGVLKTAGECATIVARASNKEMKKRDIVLMDNSNCSISVTLWGKQAEEFECTDNPIVLLKGVKVGDYNGRTVSVLNNSIFQLNPDIPEAHTLRGWFDQGGSSIDLTDLSSGSRGDGSLGASGTGLQANWKSLDALRDEQMGMSDKADYLTTHGVILFAKKENSMYMACPSENCNKKVVDQNDGTYRCEKCGKDFDKFKWRMILQLNIADHTDAQWITCFQESSEMILGLQADTIGEYKQSNNQAYDEIFEKCLFTEFNFKLRAKMETYNDERKLKVTVASTEQIDRLAHGKRLLAKIKQYAAQM